VATKEDKTKLSDRSNSGLNRDRSGGLLPHEGRSTGVSAEGREYIWVRLGWDNYGSCRGLTMEGGS